MTEKRTNVKTSNNKHPLKDLETFINKFEEYKANFESFYQNVEDMKNNFNQTYSENERLKEQLTKYQKELNFKTNETSSIIEEIKLLKTENSKYLNQIKEQKIQIENYKKELTQKNEEIQKSEKHIEMINQQIESLNFLSQSNKKDILIQNNKNTETNITKNAKNFNSKIDVMKYVVVSKLQPKKPIVVIKPDGNYTNYSKNMGIKNFFKKYVKQSKKTNKIFNINSNTKNVSFIKFKEIPLNFINSIDQINHNINTTNYM